MDIPHVSSPAASVTILVVDDDQDNLVLISYQLVQLLPDCVVLSAQDGQTALSLAHSAQPDLILLDIMLPEMDGFEVVRQIRQNPQTAGIPVVAVTAMARSLDQELALASGCNDYVCKPYDLDTLAAAISRNLNCASLLRT